MRRTRSWACRLGVGWSRVRGSGSSNSASREWGCAGVRTAFTICYLSDSPGSTARLRRCFRYSSNHPPTRNYAHSLPIAVCDNIRIRRSKIYSDENFRGYQASKKRYFYGLKIHLMVTQDGQPVECFLTPGGFGDVDALKYYAYELPDGSIIYADKAYNDYEIERSTERRRSHSPASHVGRLNWRPIFDRILDLVAHHRCLGG